MTDLNGNASARSYDAAGDLVTVTDAENAVTKLAHDGLGRLKGMTKPLGGQFQYVYDKASNLTAVDGPLGFHLAFSYDANNLPESKTDPNGGEIRFTHNASDKLAQVVNQLGDAAATFEYGLMAEKTGFTDAEGRKWEYAHDSMLRLAKVAGPLDAQFTYQRDALGRPASVTRNWRPGFAAAADVNVTTRYEYNLVGDLTKIVNPNETETEIEYDRVYRTLRRATTAKGSEIVAGFEYAYNELGHVTEAVKRYGWRNPEEQRESYAYDGLRRLAGVTIAPLKNNGDAVGNRLSWATDDDLSTQQPGDGFSRNYAYNAANQLLRAETESLTANPNRSPVQGIPLRRQRQPHRQDGARQQRPGERHRLQL